MHQPRCVRTSAFRGESFVRYLTRRSHAQVPVASADSSGRIDLSTLKINGSEKPVGTGNGSYDETTLSLVSLVGNTVFSKELIARQKEIKGRRVKGDERESRGWRVFGTAQWLDYIKYRYYNWRQDTVSDLQVFASVNFLLLLVLAGLRALIQMYVSPEAVEDFWIDFYQVSQLTFGEFGDEDTFLQQGFQILVATMGLSGFALVLALVEQAFLESLENNVKVGSKVYEEGHTLVLAFAQNTGELEVVVKMTQQMCLAYADMGGIAIVILSDIPKLEMENHFRQAIPKHERHGSCLVFRQGSPLVPEDLLLVNAPRAAATIIFSDNSRTPAEADAQALRTAVLLDELEFKGVASDARTGHIIVEIQTMGTAALVNASCSRRILPLPTYQLSARNMAALIRQPVVSQISNMLWDFSSNSRGAIAYYPELVGRTFQEVTFSFYNATPLGVVNARNGVVNLCPDLDYVVQQGDELILMRPPGSTRLDPLPEAMQVEDTWAAPCSALEFFQLEQRAGGGIFNGSEEEVYQKHQAQGLRVGSTGLYILPLEYTEGTDDTEEPTRVLICGWKNTQFCSALLIELDHGQSALPVNSEVTFFNDHDPAQSLDLVLKAIELRRITVRHVRGDPLQRPQVRKLDLPSYKSAIILSDDSWLDRAPVPMAENPSSTQSDLLRLDSLVMVAQLNIRKILQDSQHPDINIICEKLSFRGVTRFEDPCRLPMGTSVNFTSFGARLLAFMAQNPKLMLPYSCIGEQVAIGIIDSSLLCHKGEEVTYLQLVKRGHSVHRHILGYFQLPDSSDQSLAIVCNPLGAEFRQDKRVWNLGNGSCKLIVMTPRELTQQDKRDKQQYELEANFEGQWEAAIDLIAAADAAELREQGLLDEEEAPVSTALPMQSWCDWQADAPDDWDVIPRPRPEPVLASVDVENAAEALQSQDAAPPETSVASGLLKLVESLQQAAPSAMYTNGRASASANGASREQGTVEVSHDGAESNGAQMNGAEMNGAEMNGAVMNGAAHMNGAVAAQAGPQEAPERKKVAVDWFGVSVPLSESSELPEIEELRGGRRKKQGQPFMDGVVEVLKDSLQSVKQPPL